MKPLSFLGSGFFCALPLVSERGVVGLSFLTTYFGRITNAKTISPSFVNEGQSEIFHKEILSSLPNSIP